MKFLKEKIEDGVISLSNLTLSKLLDLQHNCISEEDRNILSHEIIYRDRSEFEAIGFYLEQEDDK